MGMRIPIYMHISTDYETGGVSTTHYTFLPVSESTLVGTLIAPDGTQKTTANVGADAVLLPGDRLPTSLYYAMYYAKRGKCGLSWQPARTSS